MKSSRIVTGVSFAFSAALRSTGEKLRLPTTLSTANRDAVFDRVRPVGCMIVSSIVFAPLTGFIDDHAHRRGLETVAWIALLRAVRHCHKQVHFGPQIVEVARTTCRLFDLHGTVRPDLHPHERNKGVGNLSLVKAVWSQRHGEVI